MYFNVHSFLKNLTYKNIHDTNEYFICYSNDFTIIIFKYLTTVNVGITYSFVFYVYYILI